MHAELAEPPVASTTQHSVFNDQEDVIKKGFFTSDGLSFQENILLASQHSNDQRFNFISNRKTTAQLKKIIQNNPK